MKKIFKALIPVMLAVVLILAVIIIRAINSVPPLAEDDEIKVNIKFELDEDIGLFLINYNVNGSEGSGGISNADKSMLKKDSTDLYWSFYKWELDTPADTVNAALTFTAVTEYYDPNYDNTYPEEYMVPMGDIAFSADFGETYYVIITGSKITGYKAVIE